MLPAGFEPATPASERPHIHALGRAASGTGRFRNRNTELSRNNQRTIHFAEPTKNVMFCTFAPPPPPPPPKPPPPLRTTTRQYKLVRSVLAAKYGLSPPRHLSTHRRGEETKRAV